MKKKLSLVIVLVLIILVTILAFKIKEIDKLKRRLNKANIIKVNSDKSYFLADVFYKYFHQNIDEENIFSSSKIKKHDEVTIVTFAGGLSGYYLNRIMLTNSSHKYGIDRILWYSPKDIDSEFYAANKKILDQKRGFGYWLWKPYVILQAMNRSIEGSIIFYIDGDILLAKNPEQLIEYAKKYNRVLINIFHNNLKYTKRDTFILMNQDTEEAYLSEQNDAGFMLLVNNEENRKFIKEWLELCQDERLLTDKPSTLGLENKEFIDHRHDQSILSLLARKYKNQIILEYSEAISFFVYN